ncbi:2'-5' RNA ligase family protein [Lapidilactobacillus gannanensis]|uniref:2'-5' RNA ligase family protein n=1 Tax=Lapidilactobacillus gannanensis TaxID=2486002 RepID=A0ABW4BRF6_9LACO|nr:2'-5' RNA ligase family protein [Lapidilactobacillus gannanensis]
MNQTYSILIFPKLQQIQQVTEIRQVYDPLATKIRPHISLVFPFTPIDLTATALIRLVNDQLADTTSFKVELAKISWQPDYHLYWELTAGHQRVQQLHDQLYAGVLAPYEQKQYQYQSHVTLGHLSSVAASKLNQSTLIQKLKRQLEPEPVLIDQIAIEAIQPDESSKVIAEINLK